LHGARLIGLPADIARPRPHIAPDAPLIGVVTHELRAEPEQAWAARPGREARDLAPPRLALRLTYTQAIQEAGGRPALALAA
jgi:hypothetical protein